MVDSVDSVDSDGADGADGAGDKKMSLGDWTIGAGGELGNGAATGGGVVALGLGIDRREPLCASTSVDTATVNTMARTRAIRFDVIDRFMR